MKYHIAQVNIGRLRYPIDDPRMADFVNNLEKINTLGEQSKGYVWRLQDESGDATSFRPFDDEQIAVNLTVWETIEDLYQYVYYSEHTDFFRRRQEWFEKMDDYPYMAMWWIPAGELPTLEDMKRRLDYMHGHGPTPYAFTFKERYTPEDALAYQPA